MIQKIKSYLISDFYEPAATLAIRPTPEITGRIFLLWQGVNDTNNWKKSKKRDNMPINWPDVIGCKGIIKINSDIN